jgi:hypothetical protein
MGHESRLKNLFRDKLEAEAEKASCWLLCRVFPAAELPVPTLTMHRLTRSAAHDVAKNHAQHTRSTYHVAEVVDCPCWTGTFTLGVDTVITLE